MGSQTNNLRQMLSSQLVDGAGHVFEYAILHLSKGSESMKSILTNVDTLFQPLLGRNREEPLNVLRFAFTYCFEDLPSISL